MALTTLALASCMGAAAENVNIHGLPPMEWSQKLASCEMARRGNSLSKDGSPKAHWDYTSGLFAHSLRQLGNASGNAAFTRYGTDLTTTFIGPDGSIAGYQTEDYNLDMITPGRVVLAAYEASQEPRYKTAAEHLRTQLTQQPRTSDGGFWHKKRYPSQMWLDGLYMSSPFLAQYGRIFHDASAWDEVIRQIKLMDSHSYDAKTGLYFHAWDEKHQQSWANPKNGHSPSFWGRSIGWYAMAMVDCLDDLPPTQDGVESVKEILRKLATGIIRYQDPQSGLWWQVVDQGGREGNYLETSASAMFVYALAKGINHGYLDRETYLTAALKGYEGLVRDCIRTDEQGAIHLTHVCEVAGLGFTSSTGRPRDGSYGYYISEPVIENDLKGVGPFILAGIEVSQLISKDKTPSSNHGWDAMESILAQIHAPQFPERDFPITQYGAKPGENASSAIRAAMDACHHAGGGRVIIPPGEWLTGSIHLLSNINLHIAKDAIVRFSTDSKNYPLVFTRWEGTECMNHSALIYAYQQKNIAVTGEGKLDGQADWQSWWSWNQKTKTTSSRQTAARDRLREMAENDVPVAQRIFGDGAYLRPNFIQFVSCENILIEGITIERSPMWEIHPVLSNNITVRKVNISSHGTNNDGCDPECCRNVLIEDCVFDTGDDCIAIKSGRNHDGRRVNVPSENIIIRRCIMKDGHGGVVLGSEISGGVRNVFIEDCEMDSPHLERALRFKSNAMRGGVMENVFMRRVKIGHVSEAVLTMDLLYEEGSNGKFPPTIRNVLMQNITSTASPRVFYIRGFERAVIEGITLEDCDFYGLTEKDIVEHAAPIQMNRIRMQPRK